MALVRTSAPEVPPVTLSDAKAHLRVDGSDEDALISWLIETATAHIEHGYGLALITQGVTIIRDDWPDSWFVELPLTPVQSVSSITVFEADGGGIAFDAGHWFTDTISHPPRIVLHGTAPWPQPGRRANGIEIAVMAGYGDVPADVPEPVRHALLLLVAQWFEQREPVSMDAAPNEIPDSVSTLLNPFRPVRL